MISSASVCAPLAGASREVPIVDMTPRNARQPEAGFLPADPVAVAGSGRPCLIRLLSDATEQAIDDVAAQLASESGQPASHIATVMRMRIYAAWMKAANHSQEVLL